MNKYIKYDLENGTICHKCAIMNILNALLKEEIDEYYIGPYVSYNLVVDCLKELDFNISDYMASSFLIPDSDNEYIYIDELCNTLSRFKDEGD